MFWISNSSSFSTKLPASICIGSSSMKFNYARCLKIGSKCDDKFFSGIENSSFCTYDKIKCAFFFRLMNSFSLFWIDRFGSRNKLNISKTSSQITSFWGKDHFVYHKFFKIYSWGTKWFINVNVKCLFLWNKKNLDDIRDERS